MSRTITIEGIPLTAGSRVELADREGQHAGTATVLRIARLGELDSGTLVIDPYSGEVMGVVRKGYGVELHDRAGGLGADPEQLAPVLQMDQSAALADAA